VIAFQAIYVGSIPITRSSDSASKRRDLSLTELPFMEAKVKKKTKFSSPRPLRHKKRPLALFVIFNF
jgi:hypothetical protein